MSYRRHHEAARAGIGVAALPSYIGDRDDRLVRIASPIPDMASALWLLTHSDLRQRHESVSSSTISPRISRNKKC